MQIIEIKNRRYIVIEDKITVDHAKENYILSSSAKLFDQNTRLHADSFHPHWLMNNIRLLLLYIKYFMNTEGQVSDGPSIKDKLVRSGS